MCNVRFGVYPECCRDFSKLFVPKDLEIRVWKVVIESRARLGFIGNTTDPRWKQKSRIAKLLKIDQIIKTRNYSTRVRGFHFAPSLVLPFTVLLVEPSLCPVKRSLIYSFDSGAAPHHMCAALVGSTTKIASLYISDDWGPRHREAAMMQVSCQVCSFVCNCHWPFQHCLNRSLSSMVSSAYTLWSASPRLFPQRTPAFSISMLPMALPQSHVPCVLPRKLPQFAVHFLALRAIVPLLRSTRTIDEPHMVTELLLKLTNVTDV